MTHLLPQHPDLNIVHSTLQSALQIDPNQQQQQGQQLPQTPQQNTPQPPSRKRKKTDANGEEHASPAEPRRLRRSHEACARCRSKKIKCDSKHPRCTACATAGTPCHQEDRHRQTLTPRGHTERIERQLVQCEALLKRFVAGFDLSKLDEVLQREGIEVDYSASEVSVNFQFQHPLPQPSGSNRVYPLRQEGPPPGHSGPGGSPPRGYPYPHQPMMPGYPPMPVYGPGGPYMIQGPPPGYPPPPPGYPLPAFQDPLPHPSQIQHQHHQQQQQQQQQRPPSSHDIKGQDPLSHDMSSSQALAKTFGVADQIVNDLKLAPAPMDREDLAVGSSGLTSGRDRDIAEPSTPRNASYWVTVQMRRNSIVAASPSSPTSSVVPQESNNVSFWMPKDRQMVRKIADVYFSRLNFHRPVFQRADFMHMLDAMYDGQILPYDPGYICSVYLMLALGTLSELNHRVSGAEKNQVNTSALKKLLPEDWPEHDEFFERALAVKPDLRVTVTSLQALILLHWYLYTERQGRTLWRLVGSLVRLSIELGLHHDPTAQDVFSESECQDRIRLWGIVLVHDRGTSILLGRPLAIAPSDSNTPRPSRSKNNSKDVSEHFVLSAPIAEIQADIINSLYAPTRQTADAIMRHATRIMKSMVEFRRQLPEAYKWFFSGTEDWSPERRTKLVQDMTEDQGLTLLKIGITQILLLRALFSSKELHFNHRYRALVDAIGWSHNIIVVHNQLIRFPDIAFFVSPTPLHIAAMVILFGHMSRCDRIPHQVALEDVWMALELLPSFRWRWERKDLNGGHPLIATLAERVLGVNVRQVAPTGAPMLLTIQEWEADGVMSPKTAMACPPSTPTTGPAPYPGHTGMYGVQPVSSGSSTTGSPNRANTNGAQGSTVDKKLAEVPAGLFYPFYPENQNNAATAAAAAAAAATGGHDLSNLLSSAPFGYQSSDSYMLEEKEPSKPGIQMWMNNQQQQPVSPQFPMQGQT